MNRLAVIVLPLTLIGLSCDLKEPADSPAPKTVKVARGLCKVEVSLRGVLAAAEMNEIRFSPKAWAGPFTIRKVAEHGSTVKKGDVLVDLDPEKLDQALRDLETEQRLTALSITQAEAELPVLEKLVPLDLAEADRLEKQAIEDQARFLKIDRAHAEEMTRERVKSANHWLEYAKEELKQLQKMYRDKELTEETEEIILKRQRHQVEQAEFSLKSAKLAQAEMLTVTLPRKEISVRESARKLTLGNDKARATLPLGLSQKKLALDKLRLDLDKGRDKHSRLQQDRAQMVIVAPADGIVFYGRAVHGQFPPNPPAAQKLSPGGALMPEEVFMTVVAPRPTLVYATVEEKDLYRLKAGQTARVTPAGYPDTKLTAKLRTLDPVRQPSGTFLALVALDSPAGAELRPAMNCTVKVPVYEKANALLVPTSAVQYEEVDEDQAYVYLAEPKGKHVKRAIKVGKTMGSKIEVLEGLKEGDAILAARPEEK
jgi:multidrug efflux pump subunit AcrA (membrane-fusion protein)